MRERKTLLVLGIGLSFVLFSASLIYAQRSFDPSGTIYKTQEAAPVFLSDESVFQTAHTLSVPFEETAEKPAGAQPLFVIRLIDGEVRMITVGQESDYRILNMIDPRTLRTGDIALLEDGIKLYSQADLQVFLEDFGS